MRDMKERVSVIVPIYNAETYLAQCIESIVTQDYENIQLILVDDGSKDKSARICEDYAVRYECIDYMRQENQGVAAARNLGLLHANGKYVMFVDADDYLPDITIISAMMCNIVAESADILVGDYYRLWNGKMLPAEGNQAFSDGLPTQGTFRFQGFFSIGTLSYIWGKMYRKSFLQTLGMEFLPYRYGEDKLFNMTCCVRGAKYAFTDERVYVYRKNDDSVSHRFRSDTVQGWLGIAHEIEAVIERVNREEYGDLPACTIFFACFFDGKMYYEHEGHKMSAVKQVLKEYGRDSLAQKYFSELARGKRLREIPSVMWKIMIWGFAFCMNLHWYGLLALGIKMLVDWRIDERLSDTGLRDE